MKIIRSITAPGSHVAGFILFILLPWVSLKSTQDPEHMPKMIVLAFFICGVSFYLLLQRGELRFSKEAGIAFSILMIILVWSALEMIQSLNRGDALAELTRIAVLSGMFFACCILFYERLNVFTHIICRYTLFAVIILSTIGIVQGIAGWEHHNEKAYSLANTIYSTFSNKNFFSECLVLFLPFLINGVRSENGFWKIAFLTTIFISLLLIAIMQSLAAWLALFTSGLAWIVLMAVAGVIRKRSLIALMLLIIFSGVVLIWTGRSGNSILAHKINSLIEYVQQPDLLNATSENNNNSVFERLLLWRNSTEMIADHPFTGVGLNNWKIINPVYGIGGTRLIDSGMMSYEHPHNDYLLVASEQGFIGLIFYLAFLFYIFRSGITGIKRNPANRTFIVLLTCGIIAFAVMSLASYPRSRAYQMVLLMLSAAMLISLAGGQSKYSLNRRVAGSVLLVISLSGFWIFSVRMVAEIHALKALRSQLNGNFQRMYAEANKAESWLFPMDITSTPLSWYKGMSKFYSNDITAATAEYERAIKVHPNHLRILNDLATSYEKAGRRPEAIGIYRRALEISPRFIEGNLNISAAYYNSGNIDSAYYYIEKIKGLEMSMREKENYRIFSKAIESRKKKQEYEN